MNTLPKGKPFSKTDLVELISEKEIIKLCRAANALYDEFDTSKDYKTEFGQTLIGYFTEVLYLKRNYFLGESEILNYPLSEINAHKIMHPVAASLKDAFYSTDGAKHSELMTYQLEDYLNDIAHYS